MMMQVAAVGCFVCAAVLVLLMTRRDAVTLLSLYMFFLFTFSARLIVDPAGAVGTPAIGVGVGIAWLYWLNKTAGHPDLDRGPQPARVAMIIYLLWMLTSAASAYLRPLSDLEMTGSTREVIRLLVHTGIALAAADAIVSRLRLDVLLQRLVAGGAFMSAISVVQFVTGFDPVTILRLPGLVFSKESGADPRAGFNRPYGTALHPIELSVVLAILLPFAIHFAFYLPPGRRRTAARIAATVIAMGIPLSLSRSGIVALSIVVVTLATAWSWRMRTYFVAAGMAITVAMYSVVPGLIGTILNLFTNAGEDSSVQVRLDRIPRVVALLRENLWFGRGFGTYSVEDYFLLDNQYYRSAIEVGLLGSIVMIGTLATGVILARGVRRRGHDEATRHLGQCLASSLLATFAAIYTFDAFFYHVFTSVTFLFVGCAGALWRLETDASQPGGARPLHVSAISGGR